MKTEAAPPPAYRPKSARLIPRDGKTNFRVVRRKRVWFSDLYVRLISSSWLVLSATALCLYLLINLVFAFAYREVNGIENARPGSFTDAFFFSVQTMATIGYGKLVPVGIPANILVTAEAFLGFGYFAVVTGLMFAKFSRPTARVLFSKVAVLPTIEGQPQFMFRMSNERMNRIVDATITMVVLMNEQTADGSFMRRFYDMKMVRSRAPLMQLSWTVVHPVDEESPIRGMTLEMLRERDAEIIVSLIGLDETLIQPIHARYSYVADEIHFDSLFEDVLFRKEGMVILDYTSFHDVRSFGIDNEANTD